MHSHRFEKEYQNKLISPQEAAGLVESGMVIHLGGGASVATIIDKYLAQRKNELEDVVVRTFIDTCEYEFLKADPDGDVFKWYSGFVLPFSRPYSQKRGIGIYTSCTWHLLPSVIRKNYHFDIVFIVCAPIDASGHFNFGLTVSEYLTLCEVSDKVVVIARKDMPRVCGGQEEAIHISKVDYIVEDSEFDSFCLPAAPPAEEDTKIAENIINAGLIKDGSTIQIGIGGLPNSVLDILKDTGIKHCGLHTEMLTGKMLDLLESGVVDNSLKRLDKYKTAFSFCLGSRDLYDYLDNNPSLASYAVDYINNPSVISQQPNMFSLNSAAQIDLTGQVASEQMPGDMPFQISGTGGQLDFVMGTMLSLDGNGVSVIAVYSRYNGKPKIVPLLEKGAAVTVPRSIVDHVATEWGLASLRGLSIDQRVQALIRISHPVDRENLEKQAIEAGMLPYGNRMSSNQLPAGVLVVRP
ncbi:4-hydroxybutyrate CoA-transferase [bacterium]|nr:4-hydroxybutyrate CoA-transferase [bacterium]